MRADTCAPTYIKCVTAEIQEQDELPHIQRFFVQTMKRTQFAAREETLAQGRETAG